MHTMYKYPEKVEQNKRSKKKLCFFRLEFVIKNFFPNFAVPNKGMVVKSQW